MEEPLGPFSSTQDSFHPASLEIGIFLMVVRWQQGETSITNKGFEICERFSYPTVLGTWHSRPLPICLHCRKGHLADEEEGGGDREPLGCRNARRVERHSETTATQPNARRNQRQQRDTLRFAFELHVGLNVALRVKFDIRSKFRF